MALKIWSRIPSTIDAIAMTVETPITTPRMVSAERSLFERSDVEGDGHALAQVAEDHWRAAGVIRPGAR